MAETIAVPAADKQHLMGPKVLLMGLGGKGKTYSIGTAVDWAAANGFEVAVLFTENSTETLLGYWRDKNRSIPDNLFWHQQATKPLTLAKLIDSADKVGKLSYEMLTKSVDTNRSGDNNAFWKILNSCANFIDDRTGKSLGPVEQFPLKRIFVIDSLTELANAAMKMQVGSRPTAAPPDYGVAQGNLMNFLRLCTQGIECPFIITSHIDREIDAVMQTPKIMVKSIGKALYTDIPPLFSEVLYATEEGANYWWDTNAYGVDTKSRTFGKRSKITPDFAQIFDVWAKRAGMAK